VITFLILANLAILACWQIGKDQLKEVRLRAVITFLILSNLAILACWQIGKDQLKEVTVG
jgi:hypothetical protein